MFISYFLNMLSEMSEKVEFLKYISAFTLADIRNVITKVRINPVIVVVSALIYLAFIIATIVRYEKKEL